MECENFANPPQDGKGGGNILVDGYRLIGMSIGSAMLHTQPLQAAQREIQVLLSRETYRRAGINNAIFKVLLSGDCGLTDQQAMRSNRGRRHGFR